MFEINFMAVLIAGIVNMMLGFIWYHPRVFGAKWMKLSKISPAIIEASKKKMPVSASVAFVASLLVAYVLSNFAIVWGVMDYMGAVEVAFWVWFGFVAPAMLGVVLWENKPWKLYLINSVYWLVALMLMAVILIGMA